MNDIYKVDTNVKELSKNYFGRVQNNLYIKGTWTDENSTLLRQKNSKEIIINHKGTRMVKDGKDKHGLQTTKFKTEAKIFKTRKLWRRSINLLELQSATSIPNTEIPKRSVKNNYSYRGNPHRP